LQTDQIANLPPSEKLPTVRNISTTLLDVAVREDIADSAEDVGDIVDALDKLTTVVLNDPTALDDGITQVRRVSREI